MMSLQARMRRHRYYRVFVAGITWVLSGQSVRAEDTSELTTRVYALKHGKPGNIKRKLEDFCKKRKNLGKVKVSTFGAKKSLIVAAIERAHAIIAKQLNLLDRPMADLKQFTCSPEKAMPEGAFNHVACQSRDGRLLAAAVRRRGRTFIEIFDTTTWKTTRRIPFDPISIAFSPSGKLLAAAPRVGRQHTSICDLRIWTVDTGRLQQTIRSSERVSSLAFSPDCRTLACGIKQYFVKKTRQAYGYGGVLMFEIKTGKVVDRRLIPEANHVVRHIAFSPEGKHVATAANRRVDLWKVDGFSLRHVRALKGGNRVAFFPDGRRLACSLPEPDGKLWIGKVHVFDMTTNKSQVIGRHDASKDATVLSIHVSPDGERIVTGGLDGVAKTWNSKSGQMAREFRLSRGTGIVFARFGPKGRHLLTIDGRGLLQQRRLDHR